MHGVIGMSLDEAKYILKWLRIEDTDVRQATNKVLEELDRIEKVTDTALADISKGERFNEDEHYLKTIIEQNKEIIKLLKEKRD